MADIPYPNDQSKAAAAIPVWIAGNGGAIIVPTPPTPPPATIGGGLSYDTGLMSAAGFSKFAASAKLTQTGTLTLTRYIDAAGTVPIGPVLTQNLAANTVGSIAVNDGIPCLVWRVVVLNTSGATATLSDFHLLETV